MIAAALEAYPELSVRSLCELVGVDRSWYYQKPTPEELAQRDVQLRDAIERHPEGTRLEYPGYGYRRVTKQLGRQRLVVNHKRVLRVMRQTYPNLLSGLVLDGLDQAWAADLTYIRLPTSLVYLAAILDAYSRKCIGWALSRCIDPKLTLAALEMALSGRRPPRGCIHHSDRGVQYASGEYVQQLQSAGARISMSGKGNPYDNAKAESVMSRSSSNI